MSTLQIVVAEPQKAPEVREVPNTLESIQGLVGGYIEQLPGSLMPGFDLLCNEDGISKDLPYNVTLNGFGVRGVLVIVKPNDTEWGSLTTDEASSVIRELVEARQTSS